MIKDEREIGRSLIISKDNYTGGVYNICITVTYRGELQGLKSYNDYFTYCILAVSNILIRNNRPYNHTLLPVTV